MLLYHVWMQVPISTRHKIAEAFGFKKVRSTHVSNNEIVDDGFVIKDIEEALTVEKMQSYTGSTETDMNILFGLTVDKAEGKLPEIFVVDQPKTLDPEKEQIIPNPVITRLKRNAKAKKRKQK